MPWFLHGVIKVYKNNCFFSLAVRGILRYKNVLCFFFKIIYFMKSQAKLVDSNMEFHGFFQLRRDATGAWNVFNFLNLSYLPRTATAKINQNQKNNFFIIIFLNFLFFSILLRDFSRLTDFLKMCKIRFSGSRVSKFWKIHDSETGSRPSFLFQGVLFLNHMQENTKQHE